MAEANFVSAGDRIDHTPGSDLAAGAVVDLGACVGVATSAIASGELGSLAVEGIFDFLKYTGNTFSVGDIAYWDDGTNTATSTSGYGEAVIGIVVKAAASGDATVRVKLIPSTA